MGLGLAAFWGVMLCWAVFCGSLVTHHVRVRRQRGAETPEQRQGELRAPVSMLGLLIEGIGLAMVFWKPRPLEHVSAIAAVAAVLLAAGSSALLCAALRHLGLQWRIKAVVTRDHQLVTTGPYSKVRHPVLLAFFGLTLATGLVLTPRARLLAAVLLFLAGTEIRVRAEDGILRRRFGEAFETYRSRVPAYLPFLR